MHLLVQTVFCIETLKGNVAFELNIPARSILCCESILCEYLHKAYLETRTLSNGLLMYIYQRTTTGSSILSFVLGKTG